MSKPKIFISCGQFTEPEKALGTKIAHLVDNSTPYQAYFAERVQNLSGLDHDILTALHDCAGLIVVLHPRGEIIRPDGPSLIRASVWIEQEIAIATYIQRVTHRDLPIIAFKHRSVGLEGLRSLVHLNPVEFSQESEVLGALPNLLKEWQPLKAVGSVRLDMRSLQRSASDGHILRTLRVELVNDSSRRIDSFDCTVSVPSAILNHDTAKYVHEVPSENSERRCFRFTEKVFRPISPRDKITWELPYCITCGQSISAGDILSGLIASEKIAEARAYIDGVEYESKKTIKQLSKESV